MKANMSRAHISHNVTLNSRYILGLEYKQPRVILFQCTSLLQPIKADSHMPQDSTWRQGGIGKNPPAQETRDPLLSAKALPS